MFFVSYIIRDVAVLADLHIVPNLDGLLGE